MSRNPKPTAEELRCVYDLMLRGYDDADILAEYASLYENGNLIFPYRTDKRFVRERRKELEAASEVLQEHVKKKIDPIIVKRKDEHFAKLASIAKLLLANDLDTITKGSNISKQKEPRQAEYIVTSRSNFDDDYKLTKEQISAQLEQNLKFVIHEYTRWFLNICFLPHLEAELPEEIKTEGFWVGVIDEKPYELICTLRVLAARKTFKGTCPVCKDLQ